MSPARDIDRLQGRLAALAAILEWPDDRLYLHEEAISAWSPAQHADHVLKSLDLMLGRIEALEAGVDPEIRSEGGPILVGRVMLVTGWIPRGKGESPPAALPEPRPIRYRMRETAVATTARVAALAERGTALGRLEGRLPHPLLGPFGATHWMRFADLHTKHHLAIVADLDRRRAVGARAESPAPEELEGLEVGPEPS